MPQLEQTYTFLSQVFWLVICIAALFFFLRGVALPKVAAVLDARRHAVESDLEKAAALKSEAEKTLAQYEAAMAEGREKARGLVRKAVEEAQATAQAAQERLARRLATETKGAEDRIGAAQRAALANIERVAAELAQAATERLIGVKVDTAAAERAVGAAAKERAA